MFSLSVCDDTMAPEVDRGNNKGSVSERVRPRRAPTFSILLVALASLDLDLTRAEGVGIREGGCDGAPIEVRDLDACRLRVSGRLLKVRLLGSAGSGSSAKGM